MHQPAPIKFIGPISQENNFNMQEYYVGLEDTRCLVSYMTYIGSKADILKHGNETHWFSFHFTSFVMYSYIKEDSW